MADGDDWVYYAYKPSYALAIAASAVFGVIFLAHLFLMIRRKAWYPRPSFDPILIRARATPVGAATQPARGEPTAATVGRTTEPSPLPPRLTFRPYGVPDPQHRTAPAERRDSLFAELIRFFDHGVQMWPFTVGVAGECIGYALRRMSAEYPRGRSQGLTWYISQELFIILAPACMAASHYMCFGRLISYVGEKYSPVRARRVTAIFVFFDVTSFCIQGAGGSLYSSSNRNIFPTAKAILTVGFLIQIISFGIFAIFAIIYQIRARRAGELEGKWTLCLYTLYVGESSCTTLILIRGIYRTISFATGTGNSNGYLLSREAWYYGLETIPILLCTLLFLASYPARYIPSDRSLRLHPEEMSSETVTDEEKSAGEDTRRRRWYGRKR